MFNRIIIDRLRLWASSSRHKPLVLLGARQVGKTTAVKLFGNPPLTPQNNTQLTPIEVKSGVSGTLKSRHSFIDGAEKIILVFDCMLER